MTGPTLLIAYDGSPAAASAVRVAGALFPGAPAVAVHVQRDPVTLTQTAALARIAVSDAAIAKGVAAINRAAAEEALAIADLGARAATEAGLRARAAVVEDAGTPWHGVRRLARELGAAVIVCGSRGQGPLSRMVLGSTSSGLLHHADRPVLVVPGARVQDAGPLVVGYDGSAGSGAAIRVTAEFLAGRETVVVHVWESAIQRTLSGQALAAAPVETIRGITADLQEYFRAAAADVAEQGAALARRQGLPASASAAETSGPPWRGLLEAARIEAAAVVVVGSRGRGTITSTVLGSVSVGLVHNADIPVLVVPDRAGISGPAPAVGADDEGSPDA